jgi:hypothetical protein
MRISALSKRIQHQDIRGAFLLIRLIDQDRIAIFIGLFAVSELNCIAVAYTLFFVLPEIRGLGYIGSPN